jgi:hypothetical protein
MHYLEIEHPNGQIDLMLTCDEDYRIVEAVNTDNDEEITLSAEEKAQLQQEVDEYYAL